MTVTAPITCSFSGWSPEAKISFEKYQYSRKKPCEPVSFALWQCPVAPRLPSYKTYSFFKLSQLENLVLSVLFKCPDLNKIAGLSATMDWNLLVYKIISAGSFNWFILGVMDIWHGQKASSSFLNFKKSQCSGAWWILDSSRGRLICVNISKCWRRIVDICTKRTFSYCDPTSLWSHPQTPSAMRIQ